MGNDKKPSIYNDRTTIGSANELDEYGVWVKSEPQDLSSAAHDAFDSSANISGLDDMDLGIPEIEDLPDFDDLQEQSSASGVSSTLSVETSDLSESLDSSELLDSSEPFGSEEDDFALPDIDLDDSDSSEEEEGESEGNVFNFGDLTAAAVSSPESGDFQDFQETTESSESLEQESIDSEAPVDFPAFTEETEEVSDFFVSGDTQDTAELDDGFKEITMDNFTGAPDSESEPAIKT